MKRVLFAVPSLSLGGAEKVVTRLSSGLVKKGYEVGIVIFYRCEKEYSIDDKVKIMNISNGTVDDYKKLSKQQRLRKIRKYIKEFKPDCIFPFLNHVCIYLFIACLFTKYRRRITFTENNNPKYAERESFRKKYFLQNFVKNIVAQNSGEKSFLSKYQQKKTYIIANPIDDIYINFEKKLEKTPKHIISIGRLHEQKNYPLAIEVFSRVLKKYPDMQYHIFGQGKDKEKLEKLIESYGLQGKVILEGFSINIENTYKNADIYLMSSNYEGLPNALAETLAAGIPCVSTDCEYGPNDLIENERMGILAKVDNANSLTNAILKMIKNYSYYSQNAKYTKNVMKTKYSIEKITEEWVKIIELD